MEKEQLSSLQKKELIYSGEGSAVYRLSDGRILKVANPIVHRTCQFVGADYEQKILDTRAKSVFEIVSPLTAVYRMRECAGFTMEDVIGVDLNHYDDTFTLAQRSDLHAYSILYNKIEGVVKKANRVGIVMPDLCTCDNIVIMPDGSLRFIDYDGMQFGEFDRTLALSTSLGDPHQYLSSSKYCTSPFHFTTELDKKSLTILMFLVVFNVNLNKVGCFNPFEGRMVTLKDVFDLLGIHDLVFMNKVAANISSTEKGVYLGDEIAKIAEHYRMVTYPSPIEGCYVKKLVRK